MGFLWNAYDVNFAEWQQVAFAELMTSVHIAVTKSTWDEMLMDVSTCHRWLRNYLIQGQHYWVSKHVNDNG